MKTLIVEDDKRIAAGLKSNLAEAGYACDICHTIGDAWLLLRTEVYDVVLLDLGLPDGDGYQLLKRLRALPATTTTTRPDVPTIIMTGRDSADDCIVGLDGGADDYLTKPFHTGELLARLRAVQRRFSGRATLTICHGMLELNPAARSVTLEHKNVPLSPREFDLLHALLVSNPRVMSKAQLEAALYPMGEELESNAIEVHIYHLRKKLGSDMIHTMRGVGYFIPKNNR